jgi:hypothetical protein
MYIPRDDINNADVSLTQHQELLERSRQYPDPVTPLKTQVVRAYKLSLAYVGRKMVDWGYQMHEKSGFAKEIPLFTPPYAVEKGR